MTIPQGVWCLGRGGNRQIAGPGSSLNNGHPIDGQIVFHTPNGTSGKSGIADPSLGPTTQIEKVAVSLSGGFIASQRLARNGVRTLVLASNDRAAVIETLNDGLRDVTPAAERPLVRRAADGREITDWLFLPAFARKTAHLRLVVIPYPGMEFGRASPPDVGPAAERYHASVQLLVGHGYAVLMPSMPAEPSPSGKAIRFAANVDAAVDGAIATGMIDPKRIALWGHSYGGYAAAEIATRSCRYASIIASAGVYDLGADVGTFDPTLRLAPEEGTTIGWNFAWAETGQGGLGVTPWQDPYRYIANSPYYQAGQIVTPMLIIAADRDGSPMAGAEELFSALFRQNKDAELVTYWDEGHVVGSPANVRDLYRRVFAWLDDTLSFPRESGNAIACSKI